MADQRGRGGNVLLPYTPHVIPYYSFTLPPLPLHPTLVSEPREMRKVNGSD